MGCHRNGSGFFQWVFISLPFSLLFMSCFFYVADLAAIFSSLFSLYSLFFFLSFFYQISHNLVCTRVSRCLVVSLSLCLFSSVLFPTCVFISSVSYSHFVFSVISWSVTGSEKRTALLFSRFYERSFLFKASVPREKKSDENENENENAECN